MCKKVLNVFWMSECLLDEKHVQHFERIWQLNSYKIQVLSMSTNSVIFEYLHCFQCVSKIYIFYVNWSYGSVIADFQLIVGFPVSSQALTEKSFALTSTVNASLNLVTTGNFLSHLFLQKPEFYYTQPTLAKKQRKLHRFPLLNWWQC